MHPILIEIGPLTIRTYGFLLAVAFALSIWMATRRASARGIDPEMVLDLGFWAIISGVAGARLLYVLLNLRYYLADPLSIFKVWEGGLVFYGGLIAAVIVSVSLLKRWNVPILQMGDLGAPSIALGQAIGRLGCLAAGCCYGAPWNGFCAVTYTDRLALAPLGVPLHPAQLYLSLADFAIVGVLLLVDRRKRFTGETFTLYFILYAVVRFSLEFLRGDERGSFFGLPLSPAQGIGLAILFAAVPAWVALRRSSREEAR